MRAACLFFVALLAVLPPAPTSAEGDWPLELVDPAGAKGAPADLLLPMPCGAAMAFQRVLVPADPSDPLADVAVVVGQDGTENGFMEARRTEYLRGPFDAGADGTAYYIARYELTEGQYRALRGDCAEPSRKDRVARGNITWLEAQVLADAYSRWLQEIAPPELPRRGMALGFVRLPTETEWEYATRGGAAVPPDRYGALHFFSEGAMEDYAIFVAPGSSRGKVSAVGLKQPNPLGLYDAYGNVEELILEPYRLTLPGRTLGQPGGVVTRGGSAVSIESQLYSAQRTEYKPYGANGGSTNAGIGLRFVLSAHLFSSDLFLGTAKSSWSQLTSCAAEGTCPGTLAAEEPLSDRVVLGGPAADTTPLTEADARHLLKRTGFGAHPAEIAALVGLPRRIAIGRIIAGFRGSASGPVPLADGPAPPHWMASDLSPPEARAFHLSREGEAAMLEEWWLAEMASTLSPQTERMVLFWHGLLQSDLSRVNEEVVSLARQNRKLRSLGGRDLRTFLQALLRDAATLRSYRADLNGKLTHDTTLAAFLLSLTGEPMTEADVANAARALTGLGINMVADLRPSYEPWRHDDSPATVLGQQVRGPDELAALVAAHPGTARTLARRLWRELVGPDDPAQATLDRVVFRAGVISRASGQGPGYVALLGAILEEPEFWAASSRDRLPMAPVDLLVSAVRSSGVALADAAWLRVSAAGLGQGLYLPPPADVEGSAKSRAQILAGLSDPAMVAAAVAPAERLPDRIFVRYAAEDLGGAPFMVVRLYRRDTHLRMVWQSSDIPALGGVDSTKYPVTEGSKRWQIAEIAIPTDRDFDFIGVGFTNDDCCVYDGKRGDRNLMIDRIQWGDRLYYSRGAEVVGDCSQGKQRNGELYCNGTVLFESGRVSPLPAQGKPAKVPSDRLVAERVTPLWLTSLQPDSPLAEAAIGLLNPRFDKFAAEAMVIRLRIRPGDAPELVLDPTLCQPTCLPGGWPVAAGGVLVLPLATDEAGAETYDRLSDEQRKLIGAIWMSLPDILAESSKSANVRTTGLFINMRKWQARIEEIWPEIRSSRHVKIFRSPAFLLLPLHEGPFAPARPAYLVDRPAGQEPLDDSDPARRAALAAMADSAFGFR